MCLSIKMGKINLQKLIAVLKENGCTPCQWKNVKAGDDIIIQSCKACFNQNTSLKNRLRIRRVSRQHLMRNLVSYLHIILYVCIKTQLHIKFACFYVGCLGLLAGSWV